MKTKILIILFLINASIAFSQPGYIIEEKNLNDYADLKFLNYLHCKLLFYLGF